MNGLEILISNASGLPIYEQITTQIKQKILSGELAAGEALPSIRALAKDLRILSLNRRIRTMVLSLNLSILRRHQG